MSCLYRRRICENKSGSEGQQASMLLCFGYDHYDAQSYQNQAGNQEYDWMRPDIADVGVRHVENDDTDEHYEKSD